ncbi:MAG: hypothetical protein V1656_02320 [Candidatus Jorgensenbacteria bacterium]
MATDTLPQVVEAIGEFPWSGFTHGVRSLFIFLDVIVVVAFVVTFFFAAKYRPKFVWKPGRQKRTASPLDAKRKAVQARWQRILTKAAANPPQSYVFAIIEADKCVDDVLKDLGLRGEHMADRLEQLNASDFKTFEKLWRAHRVRNELVHTPDFGISPADAKEILEIYGKFLKELEVL